VIKQWGIKQQIVILTLIPALIIALVLSFYFTYAHIAYITDSTKRNGETIASQIAPSSEYAVFSGNIASLGKSIEHILNHNKDVVRVRISDAVNKTLFELSDVPENKKYPNFMYQMITSEERLLFHYPITTEDIKIDDFTNQDGLQKKEELPLQKTIGYVDLELTTQYSSEEKIGSLIQGGLITLTILLISALLALRISKTIADPVRELTHTVRDIAAGDYGARIEQNAPGELSTLESYVNIMADKLQITYDDMEAQIRDYTEELHQTLEELEFKNVAIDIERQNAMLANRSKSEFLANISHEIRTPLSGILGFSELLENTNLGPQENDYAHTIHKSAVILLNIINDVLDFSKIESGKLVIVNSGFDILSITEEVIDLLTPLAYEKNIELFFSLASDAPRFIVSDQVRIRQVLTNLIGNAVKFTEQGYVHLHIENDDTTHKDAGIKFTVTDTGIGIDSNNKRILFDAFMQADTSITRRFGGTGLGLVICKKLTQLMGGEIGFESTPGEGTAFWFTLPAELSDEIVPEDLTHLSNIKVRVIDEHKLFSDSIESIFESWGCTVNENQDDDCDIQIISISRTDMHDKKLKLISDEYTRSDIPTLAIVSTRSYDDLNRIKAIGFNEAVFRSSKRSSIQQIISDILKPVQASNKKRTQHHLTNSEKIWSDLSILVVDDNNINLKLAEVLLRKNGAMVATAISGDDALDLVKENDFDLIFMDLHMPGLDGYATTRRIRDFEESKENIIIALTANAMAEELEKVTQNDMNDILIKPITEKQIQDMVNRWIS